MQQNINQLYVKVKSKNPFLIMKIQLYFQNLEALFSSSNKSCLSERLISDASPPPTPQFLSSFRTQSTFEHQRSTFPF